MPGATYPQNNFETEKRRDVIRQPKKSPAATELPYEQALYAGIHRQVRGMAQTLNPDVLNNLMEKLFGAIEHTTNALRAQDPPAVPTACKDGCSYCCSVQVQVLPPEVLYLAEYLKRTRTAPELTQLIERIAALDDRIHGLSATERAKLGVPCALLVDGSCSVYEARPISCRSANSSDASQCQAAIGPGATLESVETYIHQTAVCSQVAKALAIGMRETGYPSNALEFMSALRIALETPDALAAWRRGETIFLNAEVAQGTRQ